MAFHESPRFPDSIAFGSKGEQAELKKLLAVLDKLKGARGGASGYSSLPSDRSVSPTTRTL